MIPELLSAFSALQYKLEYEENVYTIVNSEKLSIEIAQKTILEQNHCPLISPERNNNNIIFTVVPYDISCLSDLLHKILWDEIESTKSYKLAVGKPVLVNGQKAYRNLRDATEAMIKYCTSPSRTVIEFCALSQNSGKAMDLGCGQGVNSIPLLKKGWHVTAIDCEPIAMTLFSKNLRNNQVKDSQVELFKWDITEYNFTNDAYDLVVAIDVLNYLPSKKLKAVMLNIHKTLVLNGKFIGSLFIPEGGESEELGKKFGTQYYRKELNQSIIESSGFYIEEIKTRVNKNGTVTCMEFIASKK
jgi:SAM-dependent methyltransferase